MQWTGVLAAVVYAAGNIASGLLYHGYSFRDQAISELSAFGSPVRPLMVTAILTDDALLIAFGASLFRTTQYRTFRCIGALLMAAALVRLPTRTVWAMTSRGLEAGFNDTMHIRLTMVFGD